VIPGNAKLGRVEILPHYAGADGAVVRALWLAPQERQPDALVIAATGLGNVGSRMYEALAEARQRGLPVVISTRVHTGRVFPVYATQGGGISLKELGCVFADNLSPPKARILLMLAMTRTRSSAELQSCFSR
jgi:L-asparaginase